MLKIFSDKPLVGFRIPLFYFAVILLFIVLIVATFYIAMNFSGNNFLAALFLSQDPVTVPVECKKEGDNEGCSVTASCPAGQKISDIRAACNLEYGNTSLSGVPWGQVVVTKEPGSTGSCNVGSLASISSQFKTLNIPTNLNSITFSAKEFDSDGGDVHVLGEIICDDIKPSVTLYSPSDSTVTVGNDVVVSAVATDNLGVESVRFKIGLYTLSVDNEAPYYTTWTPEAEGDYEIRAIVTDTSGNTNAIVKEIKVVNASISQCSEEKMAEIREEATRTNHPVDLNCNANLTPNDVITKNVIIKSSNVVLDCNGATLSGSEDGNLALTIKSENTYEKDSLGRDVWKAPDNILIKDCRTTNRVQIGGITNPTEQKELSHNSWFTEYMQLSAPKQISFENMEFVGTDRSPLYIKQGVTFVSVTNSIFTGVSDSTAVYLDHETAYNTFKGNEFDIETEREYIAVDGSAHNTITGNVFKSVSDGGIYVYRNCGERGVIRHQEPRFNFFDSNSFVLTGADKPAVFIGSREGSTSFCDLDDGYPYGSSQDNNDHAYDNVIKNNNITTTGSEVDAIQVSSLSKRTTVLSNNIQQNPNIKLLECKKEGDNEGCSVTASCPAGQKISDIRAACNLEYGNTSLSGVPWGQVVVTKEPGSTGSCNVGSLASISSQFKTLNIPTNLNSITFSAKEFDSDGGDVHVLGEIICDEN